MQPASAVTWSMTATGRESAPFTRVVKCALCGSTFKAVSLKAKYCSDACRIEAHKKSQGKRRPKTCTGCGSEFVPAWGKQTFCNAACRCKSQGRAYRSRRMDGGIKRNGKADQLDFAPDAIDGVAPWCASADWNVVERAWVALFVEQFANDGNRAAMARALVNIRRRYRSRSGVAAPQAVE